MGSNLGVCVNYYAPLDVRIEPMESMPKADKGEVLVKIEACAICGTDVKSFVNGNPRIKPPQVMGHEFCGEIVELGEGVTNYKLGQRVSMATTIGCGECYYCKKGKTNLCKSSEAMGFHYPGAMAPYIKIPEKAVRQNHLVDVGDLDPHLAALGEPMSCAMNDLSRVPDEELESALVMGLGPLGLIHAVILREKGVKNIVCVEFPGKRFDMAKEMGFETVLRPDEIDDRYLELSHGLGFDLVIITAPSNSVQSKAPMYARKGGYVSYFASLPVGNEMLEMNSRTLHYNELILYGTSDSTVKHVKEAIDILSKNPDGFKPLITHVMKLADFHKAMDEIKEGNAVKIILEP
ncbi:MAG: alcohol dehydrogenase catalytic domain-containing protein [Clostridiales bacterium]|nr:alcohol dehydrogenase catalytic domain-containing protein [Clostridiales bacterium]